MRKSAALLFMMGLFYTGIANTFTVSSNADSGPGTIREAIALAAANGSATPDLINFNLAPDVVSRSIYLLSGLPPLSSNLIIDATAQPGTSFGISNTKIILSYALPAAPPGGITFNCFNAENTRDVEIYGIFFRSYSTANDYTGVAVYCNNSHNVRVGAPGKGNLFAGWLTGVGHPEGFGQPYIQSDSIFIQSNIFGLLEDGLTTTYGLDALHLFDACCKFSISFKGSTNIQVGGPSPIEGNLINFSVCAINLTAAPTNTTGSFTIIQNNTIGADVSKTICTTPSSPNYYCVYADGMAGIRVTDNQIMGNSRISGISLSGCPDFVIKRNIINTDPNGNKCNSTLLQGIIILSCDKGIIGGSDPDKNIVAFTLNLAAIEAFVSPDITISHNSTYCNTQNGSILMTDPYFNSPGLTAPFVNIQSATGNTISGTAPAGATVELFIDDSCTLCEGKQYLTSVLADQHGNWVYNGNNTDRLVATATDVNGSTSEFSKPGIDLSKQPVIKPATCGRANGSIINMKVLSGTKLYWEDINGNIVGTDTSLYNVGPGQYRLVNQIGGDFCSFKTGYFQVGALSLPAALTPVIMPASCGQNNGSVSINYSVSDFSGNWINSSNDSIGTGTLLNKVLPGLYYFKVWLNADTSCNQLFGPWQVTNQSGPSLNTNSIQITPATCSKGNGSIGGITAMNVTGSPFIQWLDSTGKAVGNTFNLSGVTAGRYRLQFKDASGCDTIYTSYYTVSSNGVIVIDTSHDVVTPSKCTGASGSIQQIKVTGGEDFLWTNTSANIVAGTALDLLNAAPGSYVLQASNHYGCSKTTAVIAVPQASFAAISVIGITVKDALCAQPYGMIKVTSFTKDTSLYQFLWTDSTTGQAIGNGTTLSNLNAGVYQLNATDANGCEQVIFTSHIKSMSVPAVNKAPMVLQNDDCNLHNGSISGLQVNGLTGPTTYTWYNQNNNTAGNSLNLQNAAAGIYTLAITDAGVCTVQAGPFTVINVDGMLPIPAYDNLVIPRFSSATLLVKNAAAGTYLLSLTAAGTNIVQQNNNGNFTVPAISADTSFYIERTAGDCTSSPAKVDIKVVDKSFFAVATAFTPDGNGTNDRLHVKIIGYIRLDYFRIFNRFGTMVFETHSPGDGWDGRVKGLLQNTGGYVWTAQGKDINGHLLKDKGSFILIRQ